MVKRPQDYPFSSYHANALGEKDALVSRHVLWARLGADVLTQQAAYRALFLEKLDEDFVTDLRAATNGGWALGNERFKKEIAEAAMRRTAPLLKGRPAKPKNDKRQLNLL
jgi:putative transposase